MNGAHDGGGGGTKKKYPRCVVLPTFRVFLLEIDIRKRKANHHLFVRREDFLSPVFFLGCVFFVCFCLIVLLSPSAIFSFY